MHSAPPAVSARHPNPPNQKASKPAGHPALSKSTPAPLPNSHDTGLSFHLVAQFPYSVALAPLGSNALLVAHQPWKEIPLLIEGNQVRFMPELVRVDDATEAGFAITAVGGSWPDDAWMALTHSSDAGPSYSDVYRWSPVQRGRLPGPGWIKRREHSSGVFEIVRWHKGVILRSTFLSLVGAAPQMVAELSDSGVRSFGASFCTLASGSGDLAFGPIRLSDDALSLYGADCNAYALRVETWTRKGIRTERTLALPTRPPDLDHLFMDESGLLALLGRGSPPHRLLRHTEAGWIEVAVLPTDFATVSAPSSFDLWGVFRGELLLWHDAQWAATRLPEPRFSGLRWLEVWQRSPTDIWLVAASGTTHSAQPSYLLFNSADGKLATAIPTEADLEVLCEGFTHEPEDCPHPYADFLSLTPFQLGNDTAVELDARKARNMLRAAVTQHPEFAKLRFVEHDCYGEHCIGAVVDHRAQAAALRQALAAERFAQYRDRCHPPPETKPFAITRP
ncbi:MAG: hypothetical protein JW940_11480 [Polyangiaceae bacterium]|nr:hypothetical protein [Polyangiaceae bacterium]